jgi:hypothetical protein
MGTGDDIKWLSSLGKPKTGSPVDGLVPVAGFQPEQFEPEQVAVMEKAAAYGADAVFFEAPRNGHPPIAQAFIFVSDDPTDDSKFAELHQRLWSWGGVPLVYRKTRGLVQLFRCAHKPDFISPKGEIICQPFKTLKLATEIANDPWWNSEQLRNGTLWDDPKVCKALLSAKQAAHRGLIDAVKRLHQDLNTGEILPRHLRRKLLILSLLIAYLEEREVFKDGYFSRFLRGADKFFQVLADGEALVALLKALETRFNGNIFSLEEADQTRLKNSTQLTRFAKLIKGDEDKGGQLTLWQLYSFKDLPIELISHIYQLFVQDADSSVYTPPFLVRLMLGEVLDWKRLDRLHQNGEIILDPSCGSGVFLVEAYKRLVLHWRSRNNWKRPDEKVLKGLLDKVHGIDLEAGAIELAAFSLCLTLCDALEPEAIRASVKLFPPLAGNTLHRSCFFEAKENFLVQEPVGVVVGNPPFESSLTTPGAERSYDRYVKKDGSLPDKQLAYLFIHEAMEMVAPGGVLSMLQQYNFLYNQGSLEFRRKFIKKWDVRELLDFISVRGLFQKGAADTKVVVVVAEARKPTENRKILHAIFRRNGRTDAEQAFDIDYYDLHWLPRELVLTNDGVWRADLLGGGRALNFIDRLKQFRTLGQYAEDQHWDYGEGFVEGGRGVSQPSEHIVGKPLLPSEALSSKGIDINAITKAPKKPIEGPRSERRFTPPMLLVRENMDLPHAIWDNHYLTYKNPIVGFCATRPDFPKLKAAAKWMETAHKSLQAYVAGTSTRLFSRKATAVSAFDIISLPYAETGSFDLSANEQILVDDIVDVYRDLIRLGEKSAAMINDGKAALSPFNAVYARQINAIYKKNPLKPLAPQIWPGVICQPFVFGGGKVTWEGADELRDKVDALIHEKQSSPLRVARVARIYDSKGNFIFLLKPNRLRYWLRSIALRDADETLADLRAQGF